MDALFYVAFESRGEQQMYVVMGVTLGFVRDAPVSQTNSVFRLDGEISNTVVPVTARRTETSTRAPVEVG